MAIETVAPATEREGPITSQADCDIANCNGAYVALASDELLVANRGAANSGDMITTITRPIRPHPIRRTAILQIRLALKC